MAMMMVVVVMMMIKGYSDIVGEAASIMMMMMMMMMMTMGCGGRGRLGQSVGRFLHRAEASSSVRTAFMIRIIMIWIVVIMININKVIIMIIFNIIYQDQPAPWVHQRQW